METDLQILPKKMSKKAKYVLNKPHVLVPKLKESDISSTIVMDPDNDSNFNMIIYCEILKKPNRFFYEMSDF